MQETETGYQQFDSMAKGLMAQFQFFYECFEERCQSGHPINLVNVLQASASAGFHHLDGSEVDLPSDGSDPFGQNQAAYLQRKVLFGGLATAYPNDGFLTQLHNTGLEGFTGLNFPLSKWVNLDEMAPLVCDTKTNFYTEITNGTFLTRSRYDQTLGFPIYHAFHKSWFTDSFVKSQGLDPVLLKLNLKGVKSDPEPLKQAIRTINFSAHLFWTVFLIQSSLQTWLGPSPNKQDMIQFLKQNWHPESGYWAGHINLFHRHFLNYLLTWTHQVAYMVTYCIYRDKYGSTHPDDGHTSVHLFKKREGSFKHFVDSQVKILLGHLGKKIKDADQAGHIKVVEDLTHQAQAVVRLAEMIGVAYENEGVIGKNPYTVNPIDYRQELEVELDHLNALNWTARHRVQSPLWRLWHDYAGSFWRRGCENKQIFNGKGRYWRAAKHDPWAWVYHIGSLVSRQYWQVYLDGLLTAKNTPDLRYQVKRLRRQLRGRT